MVRWLLLASILLLPMTAAQNPLGPDIEVSVDAPTAPVVPETATTFNVTVSVRCDILLRSPSAPTKVAVDYSGPEALAFSGQPDLTLDPAGCRTTPQARQTATLQAHVTAARQAPAFKPMSVTATASMAADPSPIPALPIEPAETGFDVTPGYYGLAQAMVADKLLQCASCDFPIEVSNFGNGRTSFTFTWGDEGPGDGWKGTLPEPITVEPGAAGKVVVHLGGGTGEHAVSVRIQPTSTDDARFGSNELTVNLLARNPTLVQKAPWPPAAFLCLALLAAVAFRRRA